MIDRPDATQLLEGMRRALQRDVLDETSGAARHTVRVVANLCGILARELEDVAADAGATRRELAALLDADEPLAVLVGELDRRLSSDQDLEPSAMELVTAVIRRDVERRLGIARPGYST
ncbi:DUF6285 domain-containing protein [Candidatus Poriferisocius sp.]|uniref:DUF6285 domain-containing protein n=1 Tax=Candidatus Poriferisocius sp. TaxID=3101276 RepID=UPI003B01B948